MLRFKKKQQPESTSAKPKNSVFTRLSQGLKRTRSNLTEGLVSAFVGKKEIDADLLRELETRLIMADVGALVTTQIIENLTIQVKRKQLANVHALLTALKDQLSAVLTPYAQSLTIPKQNGLFVILVVGVNGSGKTTTIGKLAKRLQNEGRNVMLAAGDTFRAAAIEQLEAWGQLNKIPVIAQHTGADSASVIFDAMNAAKARGMDVLIADTAGRLHTQANLMEELKKVKRVIKKLDEAAPHEVLLVLDAGIGQNTLNQARVFNAAVDVSGICLTKLDGTAKGGIIFALARSLQLPIRFIGIGEQIDDLKPFAADDFIAALFQDMDTQ